MSSRRGSARCDRHCTGWRRRKFSRAAGVPRVQVSIKKSGSGLGAFPEHLLNVVEDWRGLDRTGLRLVSSRASRFWWVVVSQAAIRIELVIHCDPSARTALAWRVSRMWLVYRQGKRLFPINSCNGDCARDCSALAGFGEEERTGFAGVNWRLRATLVRIDVRSEHGVHAGEVAFAARLEPFDHIAVEAQMN